MFEIGSLEIFGGVACLDLANTLDGRGTATPEEYLRAYEDLVTWAAHVEALDQPSAERLLATDPVTAETALHTAVELREAIFQVFVAIARGESAPADALATLQTRYADAMTAGRLSPSDTGFDWQFEGDNPDRAWWPFAVSAIRLLTDGPLDRVKVCAAEAGCIGLFLDTSKNRSRRWCTMDGCGVQAKVQRQSRRRSARRSGAQPRQN